MKQESNGLNVANRSKNNGDDWFSMRFYHEVNEACERFWSNDQISHFVQGEPVRTGVKRVRPNADYCWNRYKRTKVHRKGQ